MNQAHCPPELARFADLVGRYRDALRRLSSGDRTALVEVRDTEWRIDRALAWVERHRAATPQKSSKS